MNTFPSNIVRLYRKVALLLLNTIVIFVIANGCIWLVGQGSLYSSEAVATPQTDLLPVTSLGPLIYGFDKLRLVYPNMKDERIVRLLLEVWNIPLNCDDNTFFREQPFQGFYVNVDQVGFRSVKNQAPWPPDTHSFNIFVFGGSTVFGYGERDNQTIPSFLQKHLRNELNDVVTVSVYNFGHAYFFSLQERLEFERLIREGYIPDLAIFIDGLNEFSHADGQITVRSCNTTAETEVELSNTLRCRDGELCWPFQRLLTFYIERKNRQTEMPEIEEVSTSPYDDVKTNSMVVNRWLENKRLIEEAAKDRNIQTLFVLQPVPSFDCDLKHHIFVENLEELGKHARAHWGYTVWQEMAVEDVNMDWTHNFIDLAYLCEDKQEPMFVDRVHYTAAFMNEIAQTIAETIVTRDIVRSSTKPGVK